MSMTAADGGGRCVRTDERPALACGENRATTKTFSCARVRPPARTLALALKVAWCYLGRKCRARPMLFRRLRSWSREAVLYHAIFCGRRFCSGLRRSRHCRVHLRFSGGSAFLQNDVSPQETWLDARCLSNYVPGRGDLFETANCQRKRHGDLV